MNYNLRPRSERSMAEGPSAKRTKKEQPVSVILSEPTVFQIFSILN